MDSSSTIFNSLNSLSSVIQEHLLNDFFLSQYELTRNICLSALSNGGKLMIAGNGGSAADAQHFAAELMGRYMKERRGLPAISLCVDPSFITAWSNDHSFNDIFARQIGALGKPEDVFIAISTSGNSKNLLAGIRTAKEKNIKVISLLGRDGGLMKSISDIALVVSNESTPRIQEIHTCIIHSLSQDIENAITDV